MSRGHNLSPQAEDEPEFQVESDLYTLYATGKQLLGSDLLTPALAFRLEELIRGIAGCRTCEQRLGDRHGARCGIMAGQTVLSCDLGHDWPYKAPALDCRAF